jgi:hypothetical protein
MSDDIDTLRADRDAFALEVMAWRSALSQVATRLLDDVVAKTDATGAMQRFLQSIDRTPSASEGAD